MISRQQMSIIGRFCENPPLTLFTRCSLVTIPKKSWLSVIITSSQRFCSIKFITCSTGICWSTQPKSCFIASATLSLSILTSGIDQYLSALKITGNDPAYSTINISAVSLYYTIARKIRWTTIMCVWDQPSHISSVSRTIRDE